MGVVEMFITLAATAENVFKLAVFIVVHGVLCAIAIGNKEIAIGIYGCFGRDKFFRFFILTGLERRIDGEQYAAIHGGFINLVLHGVGDEEKFGAVFVDQCEPVRTGKIMTPGIEQLPRFVKDQHIVFGLVGEQQYSTFRVLHHLVAVVHRVFQRIGFRPLLIHPLTHVAMTINRIFIFCQHIFCNDKTGR